MTLDLRDFKAGDVVRLSKYAVDQFPDFTLQKYLTEPWVVGGIKDGYVRVQIPCYYGTDEGYPFYPEELEIVKPIKPNKPIKWI